MCFTSGRQSGRRTNNPTFALKTGGPMAMAGLYENWRSPAGENLPSTTIITCEPNALLAELHNRIPVILPPATWPTWLGEEPVSTDTLQMMLAPYPANQ